MPNRDDPHGWIWSQAWSLMEQAERLQRQFFHLNAPHQTSAAWEPPVDVFEDEREIVVVVAMPGVPPDSVQVVSEPGALVVRGTRPLPLAGGRHRLRQLEIPYGAFERRIALPAGLYEAGPPELSQGCLVLKVRKLDARR